jgi:hypothetical protein
MRACRCCQGESAGNSLAAYWVQAEAMEAVLDLAASNASYLGMAATFLRPFEVRERPVREPGRACLPAKLHGLVAKVAAPSSWTASYYDDASWMMSALLRCGSSLCPPGRMPHFTARVDSYANLSQTRWPVDVATVLGQGILSGWDTLAALGDFPHGADEVPARRLRWLER